MPKQYPWSWLNRLDIGRKQMHLVAANCSMPPARSPEEAEGIYL
jgi:hypothetical protein